MSLISSCHNFGDQCALETTMLFFLTSACFYSSEVCTELECQDLFLPQELVFGLCWCGSANGVSRLFRHVFLLVFGKWKIGVWNCEFIPALRTSVNLCSGGLETIKTHRTIFSSTMCPCKKGYNCLLIRSKLFVVLLVTVFSRCISPSCIRRSRNHATTHRSL